VTFLRRVYNEFQAARFLNGLTRKHAADLSAEDRARFRSTAKLLLPGLVKLQAAMTSREGKRQVFESFLAEIRRKVIITGDQ
jgi:hypothetical protein